ncbi:flavodoxin domain-containing protein [Ulvibacterium sp.]|uniref:flavodoxin domain-containing protein n=1 Tax=Ulvibacterium sp. TaxID=2665914 RepID=UPI003BAAF65C
MIRVILKVNVYRYIVGLNYKIKTMKAAIFYTGKFGSTKKYAYWINERCSFPVFDLNKENPDPEAYDLLVLGSSIMISRPTIQKWLNKNWPKIKDKPILLFTVSGAKPGHPDLQKWLENSFSGEILKQIEYVPLRGRLALKELPWYIRFSLKFAARVEKDPEIKKRMSEGFDYMDKHSIGPILEWIGEKQTDEYEVQLVI